jgi:hypothetical protein
MIINRRMTYGDKQSEISSTKAISVYFALSEGILVAVDDFLNTFPQKRVK